MTSSQPKYLPELIRECNDMLHLLNSNESSLVSDEKKSKIILELNGTKEYLTLLLEMENSST